MKSILLDLYHGNYSVTGKTIPRDSTYAKELRKVCDLEDEISECLPPDQKAIFKRYAEAQEQLANAGAEMYFLEGCRLGARLMLELNSEE